MTTLHNVALKIENENRWKVHIEKNGLEVQNSIFHIFCKQYFR